MYTEKQQEAIKLMASKQRTLLYGGAQSGKSSIACAAMLIRALKAPNTDHLVVRETMNACERTVGLQTLPKVLNWEKFKKIKTKYNFKYGFYVFSNGSKIWLTGVKDQKRLHKILGMNFSTMYFEEIFGVGALHYNVITYLMGRCSQKSALKPKFFFTGNPADKTEWGYKVFFEHVEPDTNDIPCDWDFNDVGIIKMNPEDNIKNLNDDYIRTLEMLPEADRKRFLYGEFTEKDNGSVYAQYIDLAIKEGRISNDLIIDRYIPLTIFCDIGVVDKTAMWFCQFFTDKINVLYYFEDSGKGKLADYYNEMILRICKANDWIPHTLYLPSTDGSRSAFVSHYTPLTLMKKLSNQNGYDTQLCTFCHEQTGIFIAKAVISKMQFHKDNCKIGLERLRWFMEKDIGYTKRGAPSSHAADSFRYMCVEYRNKTVNKARKSIYSEESKPYTFLRERSIIREY